MSERQLFDASPVAMLVCDSTTSTIFAANDRALEVFARDREALTGMTLFDLVPASERTALAAAFAELGAGEGSAVRDLAISATIEWRGSTARIVAVNPYAHRFALAGVDVSASDGHAGIALVHVNWLGAASRRNHEYIDQSGRAVEDVLARLLPAKAVLARYAGDVFAVFVPGARMRTMLAFARHALAAFELPIPLGADEVAANLRIGIAVAADESDVATLTQNAQTALDHAQHGGEQIAIFSEELVSRHGRGAVIERNLRHAIAQRRITAVYQPIVRLDSGQVAGAEALMRWDCPGVGMVPPAEFIAIAAQSTSILRLDEWMLREACAQGRRWHIAGFTGLRVAVNVSARQAEQREFVRLVASVCEATAFGPADLQLELGEAALASEPAVRNLEGLRRLGVRVAVDDFGSGASALSSLGSLPLDVLKIDRPFVEPIAADPYRAEVVRSIVNLAHQRGLRVVAEGVESSAQAAALRTVGCDDAQGYLFGPPVPAPEFRAAHLDPKA